MRRTGETDREVLMLTQYGSQMAMALLMGLHRLRRRLQLTSSAKSTLAPRIHNLYAVVADARILFRMWGLLPILQWVCDAALSVPLTRR